MLKRSSIVKGDFTPEMIEAAGRYLADAMETTRLDGLAHAEGVAEIWVRMSAEGSALDTQHEKPSSTEKGPQRGE